MARKRLSVHLTQDEHDFLTSYVARGHKKARYINRARALLLSHEGKEDQEIAKLLGITRTTVYNIRKKYHRQPYDHIVEIINDQPRVGRPVVSYVQGPLGIARPFSESRGHRRSERVAPMPEKPVHGELAGHEIGKLSPHRRSIPTG